MKTGRNWRHASVHVAFERLEEIVRQDRAAVPCARWVRNGQKLMDALYWNGRFLASVVKPRYRWEWRR